jgi:hypothetical protein
MIAVLRSVPAQLLLRAAGEFRIDFDDRLLRPCTAEHPCIAQAVHVGQYLGDG